MINAPETFFASEFFRGSIRVPAFAGALIFVPVLHGKIAIIGAVDAFVYTTSVVSNSHSTGFKVRRKGIDSNV